ncbi:MAG: S41 family peptidase [Gammaproteobacteria bacterium]
MSKWIAAFLALGFCTAAQAADSHLLLLRYPTMSKTQIAFEYGGELWEVPRAGGRAHIIANGMDMLTMPIFSPDGSMIAFTGTYDSNTDVYVIPAAGGQPKRLTFHPDPDVAVGWTPDGKNVLFRSRRYSYSDPDQLYTVPVTGGFPQQLPLDMAEEGSYSPDGSHIAYVPNFQWEAFWKQYKGGQHTQVWLAKLSDSSVVRIPNLDSNENNPMWVGNTVYFLSDRDGPITLFAYDIASGKVTKLIDNTGFDITSASAGPGGIVYSQFGQLHIYNPASGKTQAIAVTLAGDLPQRRPRFEDVSKDIENAGISPNGVRAVFEAHGEILTVPTEHGSMTNLTYSPGVMDRGPAWSPDGKSIAYFSDRDGEYDLYIRPQDGAGDARKIALGQDNAYYYDLTWSPDSGKILYRDQKLQLWYVDLKAGSPKPVKVDTDSYEPLNEFDAQWSPDGRWIAYTKVMPNYLHAVFIYSLADGKTQQVTDGASDCLYPLFDPNGKYLYFTASTDTGLSQGWLDMTSMERPVTRTVYVATLQADTASPMAPEAGFEKTKAAGTAATAAKSGAGKNKKAKGKQPQKPTVTIDFAGLAARAVPLPIDAANYVGMEVGKTGVLYLLKAPIVVMQSDLGPNGPPLSVMQFDLSTKKTQTLQDGIGSFALAANGGKMLYQQGQNWFIADTTPKAKPTQLDTSDLKVFVVPAAEWGQMYHDAWRIERAFFYNPNYDGLDIPAAEKEFANYLPGIASRDGLSFLFREMLSYLSVGHMFIYGGYVPKMEEINVGLLGADYQIENGRYRITKIYTGGMWNPDLYAPLAQPGLKVQTGDYVLAVNGEPITGSDNIYQAFENLGGNEVTLTVGLDPSMKGSHDITVKTIPSEQDLRNAAWIDHNMDVVNKLSGGKLGYVYLPDTEWGGYTNFNRYFFSQVDKQGVVVDERFNHGGLISDYIIQYLQRKPMSLGVTRWGSRKTAVMPPMAIYGPKVMIINQFSGSGGDALPWYFKMDKVGTLVGVRTWGGLVGIGGYPPLMDGGGVTAPRFGVEGLDNTFPVENHGIAPDIEVWQNPALTRQGHDPQLELAVQIALQQLKANPPKQYSIPPWNNYHPQLPPLPAPVASTGGG